MIVSAQGSTVRNAMAAARRAAGVSLAKSRETIRSGGEDGLYRVTCEGGLIVELTVIRHSRAEAHVTQA